MSPGPNLSNPDQTRPIQSKKVSQPLLLAPPSSSIHLQSVITIRSFPLSAASFHAFPHLKIFCVVPWPPSLKKSQSTRIYQNLREPIRTLKYFWTAGARTPDLSDSMSSRGGLLPARPPLRTVRESFPSYGSSRSQPLLLVRATAAHPRPRE